jgi:hypothetical protein
MNPSSSKRRKMEEDDTRPSVEQIVRQFSALSNRSEDSSNSNRSTDSNTSDCSNNSKSSKHFEKVENVLTQDVLKRRSNFDDVRANDVFSRRYLVKRIVDETVSNSSFENVNRAISKFFIEICRLYR